MKNVLTCILLLSVTILAACGGGGGGGATPPSSPVKAILKINLTGTLPAAMAGLGMTLSLPSNVTPELSSGAVAASVVTPSGTCSGGTPTTPVYTAAIGTTPATLQLALANAAPAGVAQVGEVATVTLLLANGAAPTTTSFIISNVTVIDTLGNSNLTAMNGTVVSVVLQ